ncbi:hypothetical protein ACFOLC_10680 [Lysobacter cavernae]|uniref:Glycosyltransferase subfamily 4-like N-terminal domain-containing protein n=1 Tax=Lysobacter cavernae TaxID=1685901 RepID=A0ABV7RTF6_9GAMM
MRIVLIAYDFPPVPSPQSLRWAYLVRELALQGHEIHVLTPDLPGYGVGGLPVIPATVTIHRVYPGPFSAFLRGRQTRSIAPAPAGTVATEVVQQAPPPGQSGHAFHELNWKGRVRYRLENGFSERPVSSLNWKGRLAEKCKAGLSYFLFPDYRAEWLPWARKCLHALLEDVRPEIVVTSHEPACSLPLGLEAKRLGYKWVADLGDPVLATYTPARWQDRAGELERDVCLKADLLCVTTEKTAELLEHRHGAGIARRLVVTQGYDASFVDEPSLAASVTFDADKLELLYTGSFYSFRRADALIDAVASVPGMRLSIGTINAPDYIHRAVAEHPGKFRLLGFLSHRTALSAQRRCDVLVNIANADPVQVPGKVYEYLGAKRPIVHMRGADEDATSELIDAVGGGWHASAQSGELAEMLRALKVMKDAGQLPEGAGNPERLVSHSWQRLASLWSSEALRLSNVADVDIGGRVVSQVISTRK